MWIILASLDVTSTSTTTYTTSATPIMHDVEIQVELYFTVQVVEVVRASGTEKTPVLWALLVV